MKRLVDWFWTRGIVSTFLSGLFAVLPIVLTVAIVTWVIRRIHAVLGPGTAVGVFLRDVGLRLVHDELFASIAGWFVVLAAIWLIGVLVKSSARNRVQRFADSVVTRIPFVKGIYGTASQLVAMLDKSRQPELQAMRVVYCAFGGEGGVGFLALQASADRYLFDGRECYVVYMPTSPLPMTGGILFAPVSCVTPVDMTVDSLMQVYLSLGVLTSRVVPEPSRVPAVA